MQRKHLDMMVSTGGLLMAVVLLVFGIYFQGRYDFAHGTVEDQLAAQRINFPPAEALSDEEKEQPGVVKYAGQQVDDGDKARVYANEFIALHLANIADGKTYSELSSESRADPENEQLAGQVQTAFRGETLRGLLLTTYGFWQFGEEARLAMFVSFVVAGLLFLFSLLGFWHAVRTPREVTV